MELSINICRQGLSQRDEKFGKWKAESFHPELHVPGDTEPKKMMNEDHGAIKIMEKVLYDSVKDSDLDSFIDALQQVSSGKQLTLSAIFEQVTPSGNSLLNVAASFGSKDITEFVSCHFPFLITRKNFRGDTALHLAARAGELDIIRILVKNAGASSDATSLLRMGNEKGEAALHDAVINGHYEVVHFLVSMDPVVAYYNNKVGKSPLYLAVETKNEKILALLLEATPGVDSLSRPLGKPPAHAAVEQRNLDILRQMAEKRPELIRVKDGKGRNALHLASLIGYLKGVQFLLERFSNGAFESDEEGLYPIHVASKNGHVRLINELIDQWSDPKEFLTKKAQNILHVAAENDQKNVVQYVLRNPKLSSLLNEQDLDGNTPLHLATKNGHSTVVFDLLKSKRVQIDIANNENLTSFDVAQEQSRKAEAEYFESIISNEKDKSIISEPVNHERTQPQAVNSKESKQRHYYGLMMTFSIFYWYTKPVKPLDEYLPIQGKPLSKEEMKSRIETLLVVAVLVAGVSFAGAIQLPQLGDNGGKYRICLLAYLFCDVGALNSSTFGAIILCWAQLNEIKLAPSVVWVASVSVGASIYFMFLAFFFASVIAASESLPFLVIVVVMAVSYVITHTLFVIQWFVPPAVNQVVQRFISINMYFIMFAFHNCFERLFSKGKGSNKLEE